MNDEIRDSKQQKRKAERTWRKTGLEVHKEIYAEKRTKLNLMIHSSKKEHFQKSTVCLLGAVWQHKIFAPSIIKDF